MAEKVVLITGTRKGIGEALAKHFLEQGCVVVGCSRSLPEWADAQRYPGYHHFIADVSCEKQVYPIFSFLRQEYGRLDVLINNAGMAAMNHFMLTPLESVENVLRTNVEGTFLFCREAAKLMIRRHAGRIVNFSTAAVPLKLEGEAIYAASKAAIVSLTQVLARELADGGITVNAIGPTLVKTDLIRGVAADKLDRIVARQAIKRYATYEDILQVIEFYLAAKSDFITGQVIYLGGL